MAVSALFIVLCLHVVRCQGGGVSSVHSSLSFYVARCQLCFVSMLLGVSSVRSSLSSCC